MMVVHCFQVATLSSWSRSRAIISPATFSTIIGRQGSKTNRQQQQSTATPLRFATTALLGGTNNNNDQLRREKEETLLLENVIQVSSQAAREAGNIMLDTMGQIASSPKGQNTKDLVTESDVKCQELIQNHLLQAFGRAKFLGEENVASGTMASKRALQDALLQQYENGDDDDGNISKGENLLFIVDPIDGTTNFQAGLPIFGTSIGVVDLPSQTVVAGVLYNPCLDEIMTAIRGQGVYFNGKKLEKRNDAQQQYCLSQSVVNVGYPVGGGQATLGLASLAVSALAPRVRGLRMMACASQVMAWVARDCFQSYISWDLNAWDIAAGMLIVQEAGGTIIDMGASSSNMISTSSSSLSDNDVESKLTMATLESRDLLVTSPRGGLPLGGEIANVLYANNCLTFREQ